MESLISGVLLTRSETVSKTQKASRCETVKNPLGVPRSETVSKTQKASPCETAKKTRYGMHVHLG